MNVLLQQYKGAGLHTRCNLINDFFITIKDIMKLNPIILILFSFFAAFLQCSSAETILAVFVLYQLKSNKD